MGRLLNVALGATLGMAKIAGERNRRAFELNERGVLIAERGDPVRALDYFYEAERLMPTNEELRSTIQTNIRITEDELRY